MEAIATRFPYLPVPSFGLSGSWVLGSVFVRNPGGPTARESTSGVKGKTASTPWDRVERKLEGFVIELSSKQLKSMGRDAVTSRALQSFSPEKVIDSKHHHTRLNWKFSFLVCAK